MGSREIFRLPLIVLLAILGAHLLSLLALNDGHFVYSLDDAYIHLSLAEKIAGGTYGLNPGEPSAPSSSIVWPFLLVPWAPFAAGTFVPLVLNVAAAIATLYVFALLLAQGLAPMGDRRLRLLAVLLLLALIPGTNLAGLVLTGMEHSLQQLLTAAAVLGLAREAKDGRAPWWLFAALALAPLVRYENLALSLPALFHLAWRGHPRRALGALAVAAAGIGGFSAFLVSLGLDPLPASVAAKSRLFWSGVNASSLAENLERNLARPRGVLLALGVVVLFAVALSGRREGAERRFAAVMAAAGLGHLLAGQFGWYHRYEVYAWTATVLALLYVFRHALVRLAREEPAWKLACLLVVFAALTFRDYVVVLHTSPIGSNNIYEQQVQMRRFVSGYYRQPVAAHDLGYLTYHGDVYVLDLFGLASAEALAARRENRQGWLDAMVRERGIRLAMLYTDWFPQVPDSWIPVAEMRLGRQRVTPAQDTVTFYALDVGAFYEIRARLAEFAPTLPEDVELRLASEPRPSGP